MNTKHKITAFTLSEMVVVIILSSIVVGMAFSVLSLVQKHMHGVKSNFNKNTEINKLEQSLWIDFNYYSKVKYKTLNSTLVFSTEIDSVAYYFTNTNIIKERDTFNIEWHQKTFFFDGHKVEKGNVDGLKLELSKGFQNQTLFVFKQNDATLYVNNLGENQKFIRIGVNRGKD